jgi:hypothetical protein
MRKQDDFAADAYAEITNSSRSFRQARPANSDIRRGRVRPDPETNPKDASSTSRDCSPIWWKKPGSARRTTSYEEEKDINFHQRFK